MTFRDLMRGDRVFLYNTSNCQSVSLGSGIVGDNIPGSGIRQPGNKMTKGKGNKAEKMRKDIING